jgi:hypothetical protein
VYVDPSFNSGLFGVEADRMYGRKSEDETDSANEIMETFTVGYPYL